MNNGGSTFIFLAARTSARWTTPCQSHRRPGWWRVLLFVISALLIISGSDGSKPILAGCVPLPQITCTTCMRTFLPSISTFFIFYVAELVRSPLQLYCRRRRWSYSPHSALAYRICQPPNSRLSVSLAIYRCNHCTLTCLVCYTAFWNIYSEQTQISGANYIYLCT